MISKQNARHYTWGTLCDGWHLVDQAALSVIQERMPAGASETPHRHAKARQFFYVLGGEATLELAGGSQTLRAGQGLEIPPGAAHRIVNAGSSDLEFLVVSQPHSHGDRTDA
jgi:mannose-6-phosphate isomerase-like protein (cupin superfamily)